MIGPVGITVMLVYILGYPLLTFFRVLVLTCGTLSTHMGYSEYSPCTSSATLSSPSSGYSEYSPWGTLSTQRGVL